MSEREFGLVIKGSGGSAAAADVRAPREELDRLTNSADKASASAGKLNASFNTGGGVQLKAAAQTKATAEETAKLDTELDKLIARLDPAQRGINQMANAQGLLARSQEVGLISQKQYTDLMQRVPAAFERISEGAGKSAFATAGAQRQLSILGREALRGDFSQMPASFMVLAQKMSITAALFNPLTLGVVTLAAATGGLAYAMSQGREEMKAMNSALALTSNFAGMTRANMQETAAAVSKASTLTIGTTKEMVTAIVAAGRYSAKNVALLAGMVDNYAHATGQSAEKANAQLVKMFEDPVKASQTLNRQYHYLSVAEEERIKTLVRTGQSQEAVTVALTALNNHIPDHEKNIGVVESAWNKAAKAFSGYKDAIGNWGKDATAQDALEAAKAKVRTLMNPGVASGARASGSGFSDDETTAARGSISPARRQAALAAALTELDIAERQFALEKKLTDIRSEAVKTVERQRDAQAEVSKSTTYQIRALEDARTNILTNGAGLNELDKAQRLREINKQIADQLRGMGAEGRALEAARLAGATKLWETENKGAIEQLDANLKLGLITKQQHDRDRLALDQADIARKRSDAEQLLAQVGLKKVRKEELTAQLQSLDAQSKFLNQKFNNDSLVERNTLLRVQAELDAKVGAQTLGSQMKVNASLDDQIAKIKEQNVEIGLTKDQVALLKAKEFDRGIGLLEIKRAIDVAAGPDGYENDPLIKLVDAQIEKLRELSGLMGNRAVLQRNADAITKYKSDWKRANDEISRALSDSLMRGFEGGKTFAQNFKDGLVNMFKTLILRPVISFLVQPISGAITAAMSGLGFSGGASAADGGGIGGMFNMASAGNTVSGWMGGPSLGAGSLGGALGGLFSSGASTSAIAGFDLALGGLGGSAGAAGLSAGGLASGGALSALGAIPGWGWGLAGAALLLGGGDLFGGGGGPKEQNVHWNGGNFGNENITSQNPAFYRQLDALTAQVRTEYTPEQLQRLNGISIGAAAGSDEAQLFAKLQQAVANAMSGIESVSQKQAAAAQAAAAAQQVAAQVAATQRQLDIRLMEAQGNAAGALAARRADELAAMDASLRGTAQQIYAAQTAAELKIWNASLDQTRQTLLAASDPLGYWTGQVASVGATLGTSVTTMTDWRTQFLAAMDNASLTQDQFTAWQSLGTAIDNVTNSATAATRAISTSAFATLFEYRRYTARVENGLPGFASGGDFSGGARIVGENGPEIEFTGPSRIASNADSKKLLDVSELLAELREMRRQLDGIKSGQISVAIHTAKTAKLAQRWENNGVPVRAVDPRVPIEVSVVASVPVPTA